MTLIQPLFSRAGLTTRWTGLAATPFLNGAVAVVVAVAGLSVMLPTLTAAALLEEGGR